MNVVHKKGTKIRIWCSTAFLNCDGEEEIILDRDYEEYELDGLAQELCEEIISPTWGFDVITEEE